MSLKITIKIANPAVGGKQYTSGKRALRLVRQDRAVFTDDGGILIYDRSEIERQRKCNASELWKWRGKLSGGYQVMQAERVL